MPLNSTRKRTLAFIIVCLFLSIACSKKPKIDPILRGSWIVMRENIQLIQVFRDKGAWMVQETEKAGSTKKEPKKKKSEGTWKTEYSKEKKKLLLIITPTVVEDEKYWVKNKPTEFEVIEISKESLTLKDADNVMETWKRLSDKQETTATEEPSAVDINLDPIVVNLQQGKPNEPKRFFCLNMGLSIEDPKGLEYVSITSEKKGEAETLSYHLHPRIRDVAISFFGSKSYKDTMTLIKLKEVMSDFKKAMNPYFEGRLKDIKVYKIVVTANPKSAAGFEKMCAEEEKGGGSSAEGESSKDGESKGAVDGEHKENGGDQKAVGDEKKAGEGNHEPSGEGHKAE